MAKPTKKELLEAMKNPELLKEAGLQPITDEEEKELFSDIKLGENDTLEDLVRMVNDKSKKQRAYLKKRDDKILKSAEDTASKGERDRQDAEADSFLKTHPELSANKKLMDIVEPLYHGGKSLEDAWKIACSSEGFDPTTGKAPLSDEEKKKAEETGEKKKASKEEPTKDKDKKKTTSLRTDTTDEGLPGQTFVEDDSRPKSIREIAGERANDLAAKGESPFRDS